MAGFLGLAESIFAPYSLNALMLMKPMFAIYPNAKKQKSLLRALCVAADDLDLIRDDRSRAAFHLEGNVLDKERPHLVAEAVGIERALEAERNVSPCQPGYICRFVELLRQPIWHPIPLATTRRPGAPRCRMRLLSLTLNVTLALTLSWSVSATARSKFDRIFMASWGSMRWL